MLGQQPQQFDAGVPGAADDSDLDHAIHSLNTRTNEKAALEHGKLPDTIGDTLSALIAHVEALEKRVNGGSYGPALHMPDKSGVWHWGDFSI